MVEKKKNDPVRQHTVSKFYLENFTNHEGKVDVIDRCSMKRWQQLPKAVSVEKHYYTLPEEKYGADGKFSLENAFAELEGKTSPAIRRAIQNQSPSGLDRNKIAAFIAMLMKRTTLIGNYHDEFNKCMNNPEIILPKLNEQKDSLTERFGEEGYQELTAKVSDQSAKLTTSNGEMMLFGQDKHNRLMRSVLLMKWRFEVTKEPAFVTSDNPCFVRKRCDPDSHGIVGIDQHDLDIELYFPVSSKVFLICSPQNKKTGKFASALRVQELNRRVIMCSNKQIYGRSDVVDSVLGMIEEHKNFRLEFPSAESMLKAMTF